MRVKSSVHAASRAHSKEEAVPHIVPVVSVTSLPVDESVSDLLAKGLFSACQPSRSRADVDLPCSAAGVPGPSAARQEPKSPFKAECSHDSTAADMHKRDDAFMKQLREFSRQRKMLGSTVRH